MMIVDKNFPNFHSAIIAIATIAFLSGCTTTQSLQPCGNQEAARLSKQIAPTKAKLDRNHAQLTRIRAELAKEQCNGSIFSPANKSPKCKRLISQSDKVTSENRLLEERLTEINAAIAGRSHAGKHVKSCSASWLPKRTYQKAAVKRVEAKKLSKQQVAKSTGEPIEDFVVPSYSSTETGIAEPLAYTSQPASQSPSFIAPVTTTPPAERTYSDSTKVRVIGSEFFPDQSKPASPPTPDHAPAP